MPKQFTSEEREIIRQTQQEGAELAARENEPESRKRLRPWLNGLVFILVFFLMVFIAYLILRWIR